MIRLNFGYFSFDVDRMSRALPPYATNVSLVEGRHGCDGYKSDLEFDNLIKNWIVSILASNLSLIQVEHSIMHPLDGFDCREC